MSARVYNFLFHALCVLVYRYNKEKNRKEINVLACACILILKILTTKPWCNISIEIVILHGLKPSLPDLVRICIAKPFS